MCMSVCLIVHVCIIRVPGACRGWKMVLDALEQKLQVVMSHYVQGIKLGSSARAVSSLNH